MRATAGDLGRRALAILVLVVAAWILLKIVIGVVAGLATIIVAVLAIFPIIWAIRILLGSPMVGTGYVFICLCCGLSAGLIGRYKRSSFWLWFAIGFVIPILGTIAA